MKKLFKYPAAALVSSLVLGGCLGGKSEPMTLTILHMNDHHSHISSEGFDFNVSKLPLETKNEAGNKISEVEADFGGFPMMVSLFETLASQNENVLKLHSGDAITGTLYYTLFKGRADAEVMNQICFDAFALGNHEFDDGDAGLARFLDALNSTACKTPALAANVNPADTSAIKEGYIEPYTIIERQGQKIGIIGIDIAGKTKNSSFPDAGTTFSDEATTAQKYIDELKTKGVNKIILMTHYQYANDLELAAKLSGVDVIVGGDSHTLLGSNTFSELGFNPQGQYPTEVKDKDGKKVCVVQAWEYAHIMGKLDVEFNRLGDVMSCSGTPYLPISGKFSYEYKRRDSRPLSSADSLMVSQALSAYPEVVLTQPDYATQNLVNGYDTQTNVLKQAVIGSVASNLCLERWPGQGRSSLCAASETYANGSDISNIVAKAFLTVTPEADISIQNAGGVRVDIAAGDYTIGDAYTLLPFSNTLVTLEMTGQQIINVLEDALANTLDANGSSGSYPYASGLRYNVDASKAKGMRISKVEINSRVAGQWAAIDPAATYKVVTNNFIASGRDGYTTFGEVFNAGNYVDTYTEYAQGFVSYVKGLQAESKQVEKLPKSEYSTQQYIGRDGCNHSTQTGCSAY